MEPASAPHERTRDAGAHLLTTAGFVTLVALLISLLSERTGHSWEPQGLIVKQWFATGVLIVPYVACYALRRNVVSVAVERLSRFAWFRACGRAAAAAYRMLRVPGPRPYLVVAAIAVAVWSFSNAPETANRILVWVALLVLGLPYALTPQDRKRARDVVGRSVSLVRPGAPRAILVALRSSLGLVFLLWAGWLLVDAHRAIAVVLGLLQTLVFVGNARLRASGIVGTLSFACVAIAAWSLTLGYVFTPLDLWLLAATKSTALAPIVFALSFGIVTLELAAVNRTTPPERKVVRFGILGLAIVAFAELGLRTDNLLTDWLPYHRSFWLSPADFIRDGAWPLWDYPTQYGMLSEIVLALWPTRSTWQGLYLETAVVLGIVSLVIFFFLRRERGGALNAVFTILATCAVVYSSQGARYPMGWRLYPQIGLRFQWLIAIFAIAFFIQSNRERPRRAFWGYVAGNAVWAISLAWSIESAFFTASAWIMFVLAEVVLAIAQRRERARILIARALTPIVAIPVGLYLATEIVFRVCRGHGPDWSSYLEFSAAYQTYGSGLLQYTKISGTVWTIALVLIAIASVAVSLVRLRRFELLPVVAACWFGCWGAAVYFAGETFEVHGNGLAPVFTAALAVLFALQRFAGGPSFVSLPVRAVLVPFFVLLIAYAFGEPSRIASIRAPLLSGSLDSTAGFPAIGGELGALYATAGVRADDRVILPISYQAVTLGSGMILPFVRRSDGGLATQIAWLPMSPVGAFNTLFTLSYERRRTYLQRYYQDVHKTGWFVTYRRPALCSMLIPSLVTLKVRRSTNYQIALCAPGRAAASRR